MKKIFTIDDFITAFISAIGYGLSFEIPKILGWEMWQCGLFCLLVGGVLDLTARKIVFSQAVQTNPLTKKLIVFAFVIFFLAGQYVAMKLSDSLSMYDYLLEQYLYIIIPAVLGFAFSMALRWYRVRKVRKRYGDGSQGFFYEDMIKPDELEWWNKENQPIKGDYDKQCAVKTKTGIYVGFKEKNCVIYQGIPFAKPPVGERRWKAPEPLPESNEVFEAKYFGASAIQVEHEGSILKHHRQSEDCLTLNIAFSDKNKKKKKPVLVIFHHGDFSFGGSADPLMYGDNLTKAYENFIGVSFNYRLGIFGFIDFSEIPGGENYPDAVNLGLLDQIAALKWIKENISAFGGDPDNITAMGFEAGATSITLLSACEQAKGLFHKAIVFFGSPESAHYTAENSRELAKKLLEETSTDTMAELIQLSTEDLKDAAQKLWAYLALPTCDGKLIPANVWKSYKNGAVNGVEFITGIPQNERQIYKAFIGQQNYVDLISESMKELWKLLDVEKVQAIKNYIENLKKQDVSEVDAQAKVLEQWHALSMYLTAKQLAAGGSKVHLIYWNVKPLIENLGSGTVDIVSAFFGNAKTSQMYGNVLDPTISEILQALLKKFVNGDELKLYNNEIKGVKAMDWKKFPDALIVSSKEFKCESIEDKLTEIPALLEFMKISTQILRVNKLEVA